MANTSFGIAFVSGKEPSTSPLPKHLQTNLASSDFAMHNVGMKVNNLMRGLRPDYFYAVKLANEHYIL